MSQPFFDVIVAKEYETKQNGVATKKTAWNRVGRAWVSQSGKAVNFELYMLPSQRYVIQLLNNKESNNEQEAT